ncbi:MAG: hypothetical protein ABIN94_06450 [Ferruginibacter sp.]
MKTIFPVKSLLVKIILLFACFVLVTVINSSRAAEVPYHVHVYGHVAVSFVQDEIKNELSIRVSSGSEVVMQLFLFSPDGILIEQAALSNRKTTIVKGLKKGYYIYECFDKDARIKSGSLLIK